MEARYPWADICLGNCDYEKNSIEVILKDSRAIFNVNIFHWLKCDKTKLWIHERREVVKENACMHYLPVEMFDEKFVLQIDYELSNGVHYVHLISKKREKLFAKRRLSGAYKEKIFLVENNKYYLMSKYNAIIY